MDRLIAEGRQPMYRAASEGIDENDQPLSAADIQEQLRTGPARFGTGDYGSGYYFSNTEVDAVTSYGDGTPGSVAKAVLKPDARRITDRDLQRQMEDYYRSLGPSDSTTLGTDLGRFGAAQGYDVIDIVGENPGEGFFLVLNRTALIVEDSGDAKVAAARRRQAQIDDKRKNAELLARLEELTGFETSPEVAERNLKATARRLGLPESAAVDLLQAVRPAGARDVEVDNLVREAYRDAIKAGDEGPFGRPVNGREVRNGDYVLLAGIRKRIGDKATREEVDRVLIRLAREGKVQPQEDQKWLKPADRDAALHWGGDRMHMVAIVDPSPIPVPSDPSALDRFAAAQGLTRITGPAGSVEPFDPKKHKSIGGTIRQGQMVEVIRPGYSARVGDEDVPLDKAAVDVADMPVVPAVRPSGLPAGKLRSWDFDDLAERIYLLPRAEKRERLREILQDLNASELPRLARKFLGPGTRMPQYDSIDERRRWLLQQLTDDRFEWR